MNRKTVSGMTLTLLLIGILPLAFNIRLATSEPVTIDIVLAVVNPAHLNNYGEQVFCDRLLSNGYTTITISHSDISTYDFTPYDAVVISWDPYHITEPKNYTNLLDLGIGIVLMSADVDELDLGSGARATSYGTIVNITDRTHYITSPFPTGSLDVYSVPGYRNYMQRAPETTLLANISEGDIIVVKENIVYFGLMWAEELTSNGWMLFDRSVEFAYSLGRTIHIRPDGSIDPPTAPIHRDGDLYTLTGNITSDANGVVIERNNMTLDGASYTLQGTGSGNGVDLSERSNVTIKNMEIKAFDSGIWLYWSINNTISDNKIVDNGGSITLFGSSNNTISENNLMTNNGSGIFLIFFSSNNIISRNNIVANKDGIFFAKCSDSNTVSGNNITLNEDWGIELHISDNSTISGNNIEGNKYGIYVYKASNNTIYRNNFIDNTQQVYDPSWDYPYIPPSINAWDSGYLSGGNYWSDYEERYPDAVELDGSGIWDTPYFIYEYNQDNFPLMGPWTPIDELKAEIEELGSEGEIDNQGIVNSLIAKLNVAQKLVDKGKIEEAKSILEEDFIPQVQNLSGIHITPDAADILIESAEYILSQL